MSQPAEEGVSRGKGTLGSCLRAGGRRGGGDRGERQESRVTSVPSKDHHLFAGHFRLKAKERISRGPTLLVSYGLSPAG